ncbi:DUF2218 domain-containing protein [Aurantimicrobium minutum]|uniref:DUF2218 domain-containing protein n=1 Tax=Aurantimicrobium minutum TaxID=708131 RepID=UPI002476D755|nr:DUF2218 domain-containing protein [Aurantimicrobium minutum]MDH6536095.1 hypothetical protein [Aurantimicrobium minutum]
MSDFTLYERAEVSIERPERYGKQLASHISHKTEVSEIEGGWQAKIRSGEGKILPQRETLVLEARANDDETLAIVKDVLERHLRKFAAKLEPLEVTWISNSN